jgi:hypothetical protein
MRGKEALATVWQRNIKVIFCGLHYITTKWIQWQINWECGTVNAYRFTIHINRWCEEIKLTVNCHEFILKCIS